MNKAVREALLGGLDEIIEALDECESEPVGPINGCVFGWQFQTLTFWAAELVNSKWVKIINPPEDNPFPGRNIVCRFFMEDSESNKLVRRGVLGAREWVEWLEPQMRKRPWAIFVEGPNEPLGLDLLKPKWCRALSEFTAEFARLSAARGWVPIGFNFSVGWPDIGTAPEFQLGIEALNRAGGMVGLHEYAAPSMFDGDGYLTLRYRHFLAELDAVNISRPRIFIGECGIDGGVLNEHGKGWKHYLGEGNEHKFFAQLLGYGAQLRKDKEVVAAVPFISGPNEDWWSFDFNEILSRMLNHHIAMYG